MNVLILASTLRLPYRVLRCTAVLGHTVFVAGNDDVAPLIVSRQCSGFFAINIDRDDRNAITAEINSIVAQVAADYVIASDAKTTRLLAAIQDRIEADVFPLPPLAIFDDLNDKRRFGNICQRLGLQVPRTRVIEHRREMAAALHGGVIPIPGIAKPLDRSGGEGIVIFDARTAGDLEARIDYEPILFQEYLEGRTISANAFCRDGNVVALTMYVKGAGYNQYIENRELFDSVSRIVRDQKFTGAINFDAILCADGRVRLLECNPRLFYFLDMDMIVGLNFIALGLEPQTSQRLPTKGRRMLRLRGLLSAMLTPWKLRRDDFRPLIFQLRDPLAQIVISSGYKSSWSSPFLDRVLMSIAAGKNARYQKPRTEETSCAARCRATPTAQSHATPGGP